MTTDDSTTGFKIRARDYERTGAGLLSELQSAQGRLSLLRFEFDQLTADEKRNRLLPGTVVSVQWGIAPDGGLQFYPMAVNFLIAAPRSTAMT